MVELLDRIGAVYRSNGPGGLIKSALEYSLRKAYLGVADDPRRMFRDSTTALLRHHDVNPCYNQYAIDQYDPAAKNVFIATESPAVVEHEDWVDPDLDFDAEISFGNFYGLDQYHCPRTLYAGRDSFVQLHTDRQYEDKPGLVSHIYSDKRTLPGHRLRHHVTPSDGPDIDEYGAGAGRYVDEKIETLAPYMFQVVIENGQYPEYVSEKFFDCLKTMTIPIYRGGKPAVEAMGFDTDGIFFFETLDELEAILTSTVSRQEYERRRESVERNRRRLIEIRNQLKFDHYLDEIRVDFLTTRRDGEINIHLLME